MRRKLAIAALVAAAVGCGNGGSGSSVPVGPSSVGDGGSGGTPGGGGMGGGGDGGGGGGDGGGSACDLSAPTPLVRGVSGRSIAVDADFVYYVDFEGARGSAVFVVPKAGGTPTALATTLEDSTADVAVDDANVYILESGPGPGSPGGLEIIAKPSGAPRFIGARALCGTAEPLRLATVGGDVYWTQRDLPNVDCDGGIELEHLPAGSDVPVDLMAADEDGIGGIYADAAHIFWSDPRGIQRDSRDGSTSVRLEPRTGNILTSDGNTLYFSSGHTVWAVTAPYVDHVVYDDATADVRGIFADSTHLWIAASHLLRIDLASGAATVISDAAAAGPVAADDRYAYYFDSAGELLKACR